MPYWALKQSVHVTLAGTLGIVPADMNALPMDSMLLIERVPVYGSMLLRVSVTHNVLLLLELQMPQLNEQ